MLCALCNALVLSVPLLAPGLKERYDDAKVSDTAHVRGGF